MAGFLVDEDLPRSLARELRKAGYASEDVRDIGLQGRTDDEIRSYALERGLTILTADVEFGNELRFPPPSAGTIIVRMPTDLGAKTRVSRILEAISGLTFSDFSNCIVVIEVNDLRMRRPA